MMTKPQGLLDLAAPVFTDFSSEGFSAVWDARPPAPVGDKPIVVTVVGRRCVYVHNHRIAGGKPYVSENLPSHDLKTTLGDVLDAFSEDEILAALTEKRARKDYFAAYHAAKKAHAESPNGK